MGDMLSQAEIDALLGDGSEAENAEGISNITLTDEQKDVLGEVGNISMGTSATTLHALLSQKVMITTPRVEILSWDGIAQKYDRPCVGIRVDYAEGLRGSNILILKEEDVKIISSLMMGGDGQSGTMEAINEIDLSAISEAMNQMIGSAATSLSSLIKSRIDIETPTAFTLDFADDNFTETVSFAGETVVCVSFRMEIGTLIDSDFMQILPGNFALEMVDKVKNDAAAPAPAPKAVASAPKAVASVPEPTPVPTPAPAPIPAPAPAAYAPMPSMPVSYHQAAQNVNAIPAQFQSFDINAVQQQKENIGIIMDVSLEVTAELGRTTKKIKDILEFTPGSILELDRLAGEPIDIMVNGKFVAKGEVVVIEENFAVRVTEIINAENRI